MAKATTENAREKLVQAGVDQFRRAGFVATTVDEICVAAGVTKGAFFHHFQSKEALAEACLQQWSRQFAELQKSAPYHSVTDPLEKLLGAIDFFVNMFADPQTPKSCLVGTTVQEISETHPVLRKTAQDCFASGARQFEALLDDACRDRGVALDTASLAQMWMATIQGSLLLYKASRDESVIPTNLRHFSKYIETLFADQSAVSGKK